MSPGDRRFIVRLKDIVQDMNEMGGPDTYDDYIEVLEEMRKVLNKDLRAARKAQKYDWENGGDPMDAAITL